MHLLTPEQLANYLGGLPPDVGVHLLGERQAGPAELRATRSRTSHPRGEAAEPVSYTHLRAHETGAYL
eukprot:5258323-Pyramimonas_sp.AAC.1